MVKTCITCMYVLLKTGQHPCNVCKKYDKWKPDIKYMDNMERKITDAMIGLSKKFNIDMSTYRDPLSTILKVNFARKGSDTILANFVFDFREFNINTFMAEGIARCSENIARSLERVTGKDMSGFRYEHAYLDELNRFYYGRWPKLSSKPTIKDVIFNDPATIVFWEDGTKTVVKCQEGDTYDPEKGLAMAICKKIDGNNRDYYLAFKKWLKKYDKQQEEKEEFISLVRALRRMSAASAYGDKEVKDEENTDTIC